MIYFLLNEDERLIEIGGTRHLNSRLARRRGAHGGALRVLAVIEEGPLGVAAIRRRFSDLRVRDGWHRIDPTLVEYIGREGHPWSGGLRTGTPAYHDRLADLAAASQIPAAMLVELALSAWADRNGYADGRQGDVPRFGTELILRRPVLGPHRRGGGPENRGPMGAAGTRVSAGTDADLFLRGVE